MNKLQRLLDAKRKIAIKETLTDAERVELDRLNREIEPEMDLARIHEIAKQGRRIATLERLLREALPAVRSAADYADRSGVYSLDKRYSALAQRIENAVEPKGKA